MQFELDEKDPGKLALTWDVPATVGLRFVGAPPTGSNRVQYEKQASAQC